MRKIGPHPVKRLKKRASVLILVLIVISSVTILAVGLAYRTRIEIKLAHNSSQRTRVYFLAIAGIERCKALMTEKELTPQRTAYICNFISSAKIDKLFDELKKYVADESTELIYCIKDERAFLNINKSDPAVWENLGCVSKEQIACILDWIDKDNNTNPGGAEDDFYQRLIPSYQCKNAPISSIKELLFIKNITADDYYGPLLGYFSQPNIHTEDSLPLFKDDENVNPGLINIFSIYGDGKVNINTVSKRILSAMPGLDVQVAETVLRYRAETDGRNGSDNEICIQKADDISNVEGLTKLQTELLQQYCCFNSDVFRIFSYAKARDETCLLMAIVKVSENKVETFSVERLL